MAVSSKESVTWMMQLSKDFENGIRKWNRTFFVKPTDTQISFVIFAQRTMMSNLCKHLT